MQVLVRYGFNDVVQEFGFDRLVQQGRRKLHLAPPAAEVARQPREVRLRHAMEELGGTFVKLGQILSTRPDMLPLGWAEEFAKLRDEVAPAPEDEIRAVMEAELGDRLTTLFDSVETAPLAAASIAQVHRARLKTGEDVVLKVVRPGVRDALEADVEILRILARIAEDRLGEMGYSPVETVDQFARELRRETDFTIEGRATERMHASFADDPSVYFPRVYWEATTSNILCLEFIRGTVLSRRKPDEFTMQERRTLVANGSRAVFRQCLEIGFFHADPHQGNLVALRDETGAAGAICFIDCGMTGHIDPHTAELLADLVQSTIAGELERVVDVIIAFTDADPEITDSREFRADTWEFISRFREANLKDLHMGSLLKDFFEKLRRHNLRCPADIVFLIKAITTIEGVGEDLCPEFDIVEHVKPFVERLVRRRYGIRALRRRLQSSFIGYAEFAEAIPRDVGSLLRAVRRKKLTLNLEHRGLDQLTRTIEHASRNISRALLITALLVASSILMLANRAGSDSSGAVTYAAIAGFILAGALGFIMAIFGRWK